MGVETWCPCPSATESAHCSAVEPTTLFLFRFHHQTLRVLHFHSHPQTNRTSVRREPGRRPSPQEDFDWQLSPSAQTSSWEALNPSTRVVSRLTSQLESKWRRVSGLQGWKCCVKSATAVWEITSLGEPFPCKVKCEADISDRVQLNELWGSFLSVSKHQQQFCWTMIIYLDITAVRRQRGALLVNKRLC